MRKTFLVMSRLIDLFVDILPIDELGFKHVKLQSEGDHRIILQHY